MPIRQATAADTTAISQLILSLCHFFTLDPGGKGAEGFMQSLTPQAIAALIASPSFSYFLAEEDGQLLGVVAMRDHSHLYHLFVAQAQQRRGIATRLWQHARQHAITAGNPQRISVNATLYAQPIYEHYGFRASGPKVETKGIVFVPMQLALC